MDHLKKPEILKYGCSRAQLDRRAGWILAALGLGVPYDQQLLIHNTDRQFLITEKDCSPQTGQNDFGYCGRRNPWYFVIVNGSGERTIPVLSVSELHVLLYREEGQVL